MFLEIDVIDKFNLPVEVTITSSLTTEQSKRIERIQIRAFKIILNSNCIDYENLCLIHNLDTLSNKRNQLCMTFFEKSVLDKSGCLYYLLPPQRDVCDRL